MTHRGVTHFVLRNRRVASLVGGLPSPLMHAAVTRYAIRNAVTHYALRIVSPPAHLNALNPVRNPTRVPSPLGITCTVSGMRM